VTGRIEQFVTLWVVIDPVGTIPVFVAVAGSLAAGARRRVALQATLVAAGVLLFFLVCGQLLIEALGIGLLSFQVAGGIVLFLFALTMIFGESKSETDQKSPNATRGPTGRRRRSIRWPCRRSPLRGRCWRSCS
jgi:multiple antibiotic resistance protein